jgi:hypothetical protein
MGTVHEDFAGFMITMYVCAYHCQIDGCMC